MIEIIYDATNQGSAEEAGKIYLPNNIRQIGEIRSNLKIYLEDYVYTYLKRLSAANQEKGNVTVLLGEAKWEKSGTYIFVRSAVGVEHEELGPEHIEFKDAQWCQIHKDMEKYFPNQEIIGWSLSLPGFDMNLSDVILKTHLNHFAGNQKVLFAMEPVEKEEAFFVYENGNLKRQNGYYIYYEKNEPMQNYMVEKNGNESIEKRDIITDRAVIDFRKKVEGKKRKKKKNGKSYLTSVCAAAALVAVGFTYLNSRQAGDDELLQVQDVVPEEAAKASSSEVEKKTSLPKAQDGREKEKKGEIQKEAADLTQKPEETAEDRKTERKERKEEKPGEQVSAGSYQRYIVKRGDTLTKISEIHYGGLQKVEDICRINGLDSEDLIYAGQIILLP